MKIRANFKALEKQASPINNDRRLLKFPVAIGKTVAEVDFSTSAEDHSITLVFSDQTMLHFNIDPGFTISADYSDLKTGDVKPIRRWKAVRSWLFRE